MILVEVNAYSYSTSYPEKLEITLGSNINPNEQTVIIPSTQLDWTESQTLGGSNLTENVTVTAYRNNIVVGSKTLAPGANGSIADNNALNGVNNYVIITSNSWS